MKYFILFLGFFLLHFVPSYGQMSIVHTFPSTIVGFEVKIVDLSISGKKIAMLRPNDGASNGPDTIFYYNLDYSFWKMIVCPALPHSMGYFSFNNNGVSYSSETLFNTDNLLEAAVYYYYKDTVTHTNYTNLYIINENGILTDSLTKLSQQIDFTVHELSPTNFIAMVTYSSASGVSGNNGVEIINLPGTLPCNICGGLGLAKTTEKPIDILSAPIPNPSINQVKIAFTLPDGANMGELTIYNTDGQKVKSYTVDNRFGFIMLDDSQFVPGVYYYNLVVNGLVSSTQKMLVIK